jgi:hypothetical protein
VILEGVVNSDEKLADYNTPIARETAVGLTGNTSTVPAKLNRLFHHVRDEIRFGLNQNGDLVKASTTITKRQPNQSIPLTSILLASFYNLGAFSKRQVIAIVDRSTASFGDA